MKRLVTRKSQSIVAAMLLLPLLMPWNATAIHFADRPSRLEAFIQGSPREIEGLLVKSLLEITQGKLDQALKDVDAVIHAVPNFKLAYLVRGDLLQAKARQISDFGSVPNAPSGDIADFRQEAQVRLSRYLSQEGAPSNLDYLWQLDSAQQNAIVVDTVKSRMYLYRNANGQPRYAGDYYVTVGKNGSEKQKEGDKKTPLGVYIAGTKLASNKLPDLYGAAAYPLNYPNEWDRQQGKNGHGIWLHGTPSDTYSRPPRASDGCVVLTNPDIQGLAEVLKNGNTPVVIVGEDGVSAPELARQKAALTAALEQWRRDWQQQQTEAYLAHYSRDFFSEKMDLAAWAAEKRRIQSRKSNVSVNLSEISIFRYPDARKQMAVVNFNQDYKADHFTHKMRKRQYWVLENGRWKILYEGSA